MDCNLNKYIYILYLHTCKAHSVWAIIMMLNKWIGMARHKWCHEKRKCNTDRRAQNPKHVNLSHISSSFFNVPQTVSSSRFGPCNLALCRFGWFPIAQSYFIQCDNLCIEVSNKPFLFRLVDFSCICSLFVYMRMEIQFWKIWFIESVKSFRVYHYLQK